MANEHATATTDGVNYSAIITWAVAVIGLVAVLPLLWMTYTDSLSLLEGLVATFLAGIVGIIALSIALIVYPTDSITG